MKKKLGVISYNKRHRNLVLLHLYCCAAEKFLALHLNWPKVPTIVHG